MLFYREAVQAERDARADRIVDTSAGMWGGDESRALLKQLKGQ